jgi:hypothetical protein
MNRDEALKKAMAKRKERKQEEEERKNYSSNMETIEYSALHLNEYRSFRFLGNFIDYRDGDPCSAKEIYYSMITGDNDKKFRCIWPAKSENESWIMWKVLSRVMAYTFVDGERSYTNKSTHPNLFWRVNKNGRKDQPYERGWYPRRFVVANVIARDKMSWHKDNKHSVLLSRKVSEYGEGKSFYDPGIPITVYNLIFDDIVSYAGDWQDYDVVIKRLKDKPFYKVYHGVNDYEKFEAGVEDYNVDLAKKSLSEEELSWERYNIDNLFPVTSYQKIHNRLKLFIGQVDEVFHTNYVEELKDLAEEEKAKMKAEKEEKKEQVTSSGYDVEEPKDIEKEGVKETSPVAKRRERKKATEEVWKTLDVDVPYVSKLTDKEKETITGFDKEKGTLTYKEGSGEIYSCLNEEDNGCTMRTPDFFHMCPLCGEAFE